MHERRIHAVIYLSTNLKGKGIAKKDELNEYAAAAIYANILSFVNDYPDQWNEVAKYFVYFIILFF